jgi:hypothetical protein
MKKIGRQIMKIVNSLNHEIRWRYSNLYQSLTEHRVHSILENLRIDSESHNMAQGSMRVSDYVNSRRGT